MAENPTALEPNIRYNDPMEGVGTDDEPPLVPHRHSAPLPPPPGGPGTGASGNATAMEQVLLVTADIVPGSIGEVALTPTCDVVQHSILGVIERALELVSGPPRIFADASLASYKTQDDDFELPETKVTVVMFAMWFAMMMITSKRW